MPRDDRNLTVEQRRRIFDQCRAQAVAEWKAKNAARYRRNGGRRFNEGTNTAAHLRAFFNATRKRAEKLFGGKRP